MIDLGRNFLIAMFLYYVLIYARGPKEKRTKYAEIQGPSDLVCKLFAIVGSNYLTKLATPLFSCRF